MKTKGNVIARSITETDTFITDTGTTNAYAVTLRPAITAYTTGLKVTFQATSANTGACTLAVNGLTAKSIKKDVTSDLIASDIAANSIVTVIYDGTNFQMRASAATRGASITGLRKGTGDPNLDVAAVPGVDYALPTAVQQTNNGLISGGGVVWTGSLNFTVSAATYAINGTQYSSSQTNLSLGAADATFDRYDVIAVNTSSAAVVIAGTPAAVPLVPTVDPATQLQLTFVYVAATATTPSNIVNTVLYAENTEYTSSVSGASFNAASTNNPHAGTKDIEATAAGTSDYVQLQKPSGTLDLSTQNSLAFYIRSKASWANNRSLTIAWFNSGAQVGNGITFKEGSFGFSSSTTSSYQQILIPIAQFNTSANAVNQLRFTVSGTGGSLGFYLDDISLQSGVMVNTQTYMLWRGTWNATTAYVQNDTIIYNGIAYVALIANTNSTPTNINTNWAAIVTNYKTIKFGTDGGGLLLQTGVKGYFTPSYNGKIVGWSIEANGSSPTCTWDIWRIAAGGTALPTVSNTIMGTKPALSTGNKIRSTTMTAWSPLTFSAGDTFAANLDAVTIATWASITLEVIQQ